MAQPTLPAAHPQTHPPTDLRRANGGESFPQVDCVFFVFSWCMAVHVTVQRMHLIMHAVSAEQHNHARLVGVNQPVDGMFMRRHVAINKSRDDRSS